MAHLVFHALFADVHPPVRATEGSAGLDLSAHLTGRQVRVWRQGVLEERATEDRDGVGCLVLAPSEKALVPLGFRAGLPAGFEAQIRPRSGTSVKTDLVIANAPGTVDPDYPDEWCVPVRNGGDRPLIITHGERIAQMVVARFEVPTFVPGQVGATTSRSGGFGSTGSGGAAR